MLKQLFQENSVKFQQLKQLYRYIHIHGPISKSSLLELTKLKQTTMVRYLDELMERNLIQISKYDKSTGGRPPALYQITPELNYIIGVDISRIDTKIYMVDLNFNPVDSYSFAMTEAHTPRVTIDLIKQNINALLDNNNISVNQLLGIGIGAVGPLDRENGLILQPEFFPAPGWKNISIVKELQTAFPDQQVLLENGANTAALAEYYHASEPYRNILYCISGIGLRCGVLSNGRFVQNTTGDASAFGQMIIDVSDEINGENRTLSSYISLDSILDEIKQRAESNGSSNLINSISQKWNSTTTKHLLSQLEQGDPLVEEVVMKSAYYYGIGLANIVNILHPEQVILSSTLIYQFPAYYQKVVDTAKKHIFRYNHANISFGLGKLKESAVAIGASVLIFDSYFQK